VTAMHGLLFAVCNSDRRHRDGGVLAFFLGVEQ